jgi:hypothetical protein
MPFIHTTMDLCGFVPSKRTYTYSDEESATVATITSDYGFLVAVFEYHRIGGVDANPRLLDPADPFTYTLS